MNDLLYFLKGAIIGIATLIPGASGGTMAIILGIYDDLVHAVGSFFADWEKNLRFLLTVGLGGIFSLLIFSPILEKALTAYPHEMQFLFMGFIVGGLPVLYRKSISVGKGSKTDLIFLIIGLILILILTTTEPNAIIRSAGSNGLAGMLFLLVAGIIIAVALVLPGLSASYMLLVLGLYSITLHAVNTLSIAFLIPLGCGILIGTLGTAKAVERLLQKYPGRTYMAIIGFVLGSLIPVFPGIPSGAEIITCISGFVAGFSVIYWLGKNRFTDQI